MGLGKSRMSALSVWSGWVVVSNNFYSKVLWNDYQHKNILYKYIFEIAEKFSFFKKITKAILLEHQNARNAQNLRKTQLRGWRAKWRILSFDLHSFTLNIQSKSQILNSIRLGIYFTGSDKKRCMIGLSVKKSPKMRTLKHKTKECTRTNEKDEK